VSLNEQKYGSSQKPSTSLSLGSHQPTHRLLLLHDHNHWRRSFRLLLECVQLAPVFYLVGGSVGVAEWCRAAEAAVRAFAIPLGWRER